MGALEQLGLNKSDFDEAALSSSTVEGAIPPRPDSALAKLGLSAEDFAPKDHPAADALRARVQESQLWFRENPKTVLGLAAAPFAPALGGASMLGRVLSSGAVMGGANVAGQIAEDEAFDPKEAAMATALAAGGQAIGEGAQFLPAAIKALLRGPSSAKDVQQAIDDLAGAGVSPSVAQATRNPIMEGLESFAAKAPGGAGRIRRAAEEATQKVRAFVDETAERVAGRSASRIDPTAAGLEIKRGVANFTKSFQDKADDLFGRLHKEIPSDRALGAGNTIQTLDDLSATIKGAEESSELLVQPFIRDFTSRFKADAVDGKLPAEAMFQLRSLIGRKLGDASLMSDLPRAELKRIYGAMSDDLAAAAKEAGPAAEKAFSRANSYYRSGIKRIDDVLEPLIKKKVPERVFKILETGGKQGATQLRTLRRSLDDEQWKVIAATATRNLGRANPSQQGAEGAEFSFSTFLTRWNQLDKEAKDALFANVGTLKNDLNAIARAAERIRESSQAYFNPSGTAPAAALIGTGAAAATAAATGQFQVLGLIGAGMMGSNGLARAMTNPKLVKWLAESTRIDPNGWAPHIGRLAALAKTQSEDDREVTLELLDALDRAMPATEEQSAAPPSFSPLLLGGGGPLQP